MLNNKGSSYWADYDRDRGTISIILMPHYLSSFPVQVLDS